MAAAQDYRRCGDKHEFIQPFLKNKNERTFKLNAEFYQRWSATIADTTRIIATIPQAWETLGFIPDGKLISNATFDCSRNVGGADAQIIVGNTLIDVRTTAKSRPFSLSNFYQQIAYCLMDTSDRYWIIQLAWFYSRQQSVFLYPVTSLFRNLEDTRREFAQMINENYTLHSNLSLDLGLLGRRCLTTAARVRLWVLPKFTLSAESQCL